MQKNSAVILFSLLLLAAIVSVAGALSTTDFTNFKLANGTFNSSTNNTQTFVYKYVNATQITASCLMYYDGVLAHQNDTTLTAVNDTFRINVSLGSDGRHTWFVNCTNTTTVTFPTQEFILDTASPTGVTMSTPTNNYNTTNATILFTALGLDAIGDYYGSGKILRYNVTANGVANRTILNFGNDTTFTFLETYTNGAWQVNITAYDNASNSATSSTVTFRVDSTAPTFAQYSAVNVSGGVNMTARFNFSTLDAQLPTLAYVSIYSNGTKVNRTGTQTRNTTGTSVMNQIDLAPSDIPYDGYFVVEPHGNDTLGNDGTGTNQTNWTKITLLGSKWTLVQVDMNQSLINVSNYSSSITKVAWYNTSSNAFQTFTVGAVTNAGISVVDGDSVYVYTTEDVGLLRKWSQHFVVQRNISLATGWNFISAMNESIQMWQVCDWPVDNASAALKAIAVFDTPSQVYKSQTCSVQTGNNNNLTVVRGRGIVFNVNTTTRMSIYR